MEKSHPTARFCTSRRKLYSAIAFSIAFASQAHAGPSGGAVVGGDGSISQVGNETTIIQESDRLAIDWDSFNVAADERVEFIQPGSDSLALNRILGNDASHILGKIDANGHVVLVNPNGILFGESATVNVGGLVASGLDIKTKDFMNGDLVFKDRGNKEGFVINRGLINAATARYEHAPIMGSDGNVVLLGKQVANEGMIDATLGTVTLAAGREAVLTFDPQGLIGVRITKETLQKKLGMDAAVSNSGSIEAIGGRVLLTASVSDDVFSQAVNTGDMTSNTDVLVHADGSFTLGKGASVVNSGDINVSSQWGDYEFGGPGEGEVVSEPGAAVLLGADVQHSGAIDASDVAGDGGEVVLASSGRTWVRGGNINVSSVVHGRYGLVGDSGDVTLLGKQVGLTEDATIYATGDQAGTVTIGGKGSTPPSRLNDTEIALVGEDVRIIASNDFPDESAAGGQINVWSTYATVVEGALDVSGYSSGGSVVLESGGTLGYTGEVNLSAFNEGELTLRADQLVITEEPTFFTISRDALQQAMESGDVVLDAASSVEIDEPTSLFLYNDFTANAQGQSADKGGVVDLSGLTLDASQVPSEVTVSVDADVIGVAPTIGTGVPEGASKAAPVNVHLTSSNGDILHESSVYTQGGDYQALAQGDVIFSGDSALHTEAGGITGGEPDAATAIAIDAGGDVQLALGSGRPSLDVQGADVSISTPAEFTGQVQADNLSLELSGAGAEGIEAQLAVSGVTRVAGDGTFTLSLSGDLNVLEVDNVSESIVEVVEENDLTLGNIGLLFSSLFVRSEGEGATVSQAQNSTVDLYGAFFSLEADNISLGADGSSLISSTGSAFDAQFNDSLSVNGGVLGFDDNANSRLEIIGSDADNVVNIGEFAQFSEPGLENRTIDFGAGNDTVNLAADVAIPFSLGAGADVINLLAPDVQFTALDFDESEDTVNAYMPQ